MHDRPRLQSMDANIDRRVLPVPYVIPDCIAWTGWGNSASIRVRGEQRMKNADQISLRQLRCFVTVANELHFRRAAEKLNMRQPPLTQRIQDMERDLGVQLFRRLGNKVELTH